MRQSKTKARLFVAEDLHQGGGLCPTTDQAHYLLKVMRVVGGDTVVVFNGRHGEWRCHVEDAGKKSCTLRIEAQLREQEPAPDPWLAFAPLKKTNTDFLVEKATELGVARLIPVFSEHTNTGRVNTRRLGPSPWKRPSNVTA